MRKIGRRIALVIGCAAAITMGGAGSAGAHTVSPYNQSCSVSMTRPQRSNNEVYVMHYVSCSVSTSLQLRGMVSGPGGYDDRFTSCSSCSSLSLRTAAPYASGFWNAATETYGKGYASSSATLP